MPEIPAEEVEKEWRELEPEIKKLESIASVFREHHARILEDLKRTSSWLRNHIELSRDEISSRIPYMPAEIWRKAILISKNLGIPLNIVIGDLIVKELSKDPNEIVEYRLKLCDEMLKHGEELLAKEDIMEASEKFWNAVVQAIKALAITENIELKTHRELWDYVKKLARKLNDVEIEKLFADANYLHINFYEGYLSPTLTENYITSAKKLIDKLKNLISSKS